MEHRSSAFGMRLQQPEDLRPPSVALARRVGHQTSVHQTHACPSAFGCELDAHFGFACIRLPIAKPRRATDTVTIWLPLSVTRWLRDVKVVVAGYAARSAAIGSRMTARRTGRTRR